jgi:hypothetical protein
MVPIADPTFQTHWQTQTCRHIGQLRRRLRVILQPAGHPGLLRKIALDLFSSSATVEQPPRRSNLGIDQLGQLPRSIFLWPPLQALRDALALPSGVLGPVDHAHGCHARISAACPALRSDVQPFINGRCQLS